MPILRKILKKIKRLERTRAFKYLILFVFFNTTYKAFIFIPKYDLYEDALSKQNVTNFKIMCDKNKKFLEKADFVERLLNDSLLTKKLSLIKHDLFKYCDLSLLKKQFKSNSVYFLKKFEFLISSSKSDMKYFDKLQPGGYFNQSDFCIHEYLYYLYLKTGVIPNSQTQIPLNNSKLIKKFKNIQSLMTFIIIPYLNREDNLKDFLFNVHRFLQHQFINSYKIIVAEQNVDDPDKPIMFNKGRLYNMAYKYIKSKYSIDKIKCLIFHDVDLLPESEYNFYECDNFGNAPRHLSFFIRSENSNDIKYEKNSYDMLVGGVLLVKPKMFEFTNGYSNRFWNWGGEDDGKKLFYYLINSKN